MKILFVAAMVPYLPCHEGCRLIPAHLLKILSQRREFSLIASDEARIPV